MSASQRKCFTCRAPFEGTALYCGDCGDLPIKTSGTLVIFDKV